MTMGFFVNLPLTIYFHLRRRRQRLGKTREEWSKRRSLFELCVGEPLLVFSVQTEKDERERESLVYVIPIEER